jgi:hypothetical protein
MDSQVRRIVERLEHRGELDQSLVVVTADHGEGFGEPSPVREDWRIVGHGNGGVDNPLVHVPLVVRFPDGGPEEDSTGGQVSTPASLTGFADAVAAVVADRTNGNVDIAIDLSSGAAAWRDPFVPMEAVTAATDGLDPDTKRAAKEYCDDLGPLLIPADAVYDVENLQQATDHGDRVGTGKIPDGRVLKSVRWGDVTARLNVTDGREVVEAFDDRGRTDQVVDELTDAEVRIDGEGGSNIDQEVRSRLEDLGYA